MHYKTEMKLLEKQCDDLQDIIAELASDIKRVNKHRHFHMRGGLDHHTKYQSVKEHIEGLSHIIRNRINDMNESQIELDNCYDRLQTLYMYADADADLEADAKLSFKLFLQEVNYHE